LYYSLVNTIETLEQAQTNKRRINNIFGKENRINKWVVIMKMDNSKFDTHANLKNGVHKDFFKDGSVSCEGNFEDRERTGEWKYYLANGRLKAIGNYTNGKMTGEWKWYRDNGKLMQTGSFDNEIKTGLWTRYREDSTLLDETEFRNGKKGKIKMY
jgi:antitoxin component YwqK of YwqJK toxin-antitoxin module